MKLNLLIQVTDYKEEVTDKDLTRINVIKNICLPILGLEKR